MPLTTPATNFFTIEFILLLKWGILILLGLYIIFSLIIVRQVGLMSRILITPVAPIVKFLAIINLGFAIGFFILAFGSL